MYNNSKKIETHISLDHFKRIYLARQPIFDTKKNVIAYEILFRSGFDNACTISSSTGDEETSTTLINSFIHFGLDYLTEGKPAFINFTKNLLLNDSAVIFPKELLTIEILENVLPENDIIIACKKIKRNGYTLALDDFIFSENMMPLVHIADIIKIDFREYDTDNRADIISRISSTRIKYLAEKVETYEEFEEAKLQGFTMFQGYFFSKPHIIQGHDIRGYKLTYLQILKEIFDPELDFDTLDHIVKRDVSLTYKLLRFINSAAFGFKVKITSIRQALTLLGIVEFKKWVSLVSLSGMGEDKPEELLINSMMRAKFCEFLSSKTSLKDKADILFLIGMLSNISAFIDLPMNVIVEQLPLADSIKKTLCGEDNLFQDILQSVISYERGEWLEWGSYCRKCGVKETDFPEIFINTLDWVKKIFR